MKDAEFLNKLKLCKNDQEIFNLLSKVGKKEEIQEAIKRNAYFASSGEIKSADTIKSEAKLNKRLVEGNRSISAEEAVIFAMEKYCQKGRNVQKFVDAAKTQGYSIQKPQKMDREQGARKGKDGLTAAQRKLRDSMAMD